MVFHGSLISRTLLSVLDVLNNVVVWMVFTRPLISRSSSSFHNPLVTVPKAPITIGIIVTFMFHSFSKFPCKVQVFILIFTFFQFFLWSAGTAKSTILQVLFVVVVVVVVDYYKGWSVFWPRLSDPFVCQIPIGVYVFHSPGQMLGCAYTICSYGQI